MKVLLAVVIAFSFLMAGCEDSGSSGGSAGLDPNDYGNENLSYNSSTPTHASQDNINYTYIPQRTSSTPQSQQENVNIYISNPGNPNVTVQQSYSRNVSY